MPVDPQAYLAAAEAALDLQLSPESRAGVEANLRILFAMAATFEAVELDPHLDPLPVHRP